MSPTLPDDPVLLVATALLAAVDRDRLMARAGELAATTRDRQLVAIATAHLCGDDDLVDALARDHLVDHPDSVLVAWMAGARHRASGAADPPSNKESSCTRSPRSC